MEKRFILRGFGAGALAGLFAFIFARIMAEPIIQQAINYESGRDAAQDALRKAAGLALEPAGPDIFSRGIQRNVGIGVGLILFGAAMGGLFAVTYILVQRRTRTTLRPRVLALAIAGAAFLGLYLVPFLKYPANPPAIGHENTIGDRTLLYVIMVVLSVTLLIGAVIAARKLMPRLGAWNATLWCGAGYAVVMAVVMAILPPLGHLHANVVEYGRHVTETPLPLRDANGNIVYPGFPADTLFKFRLYSVINQVILWGTIGLTFGWLVERMLAPAPSLGSPRTAQEISSPGLV
ncbi:MAG TPA: CbtA family protein [Solirubrobacterales bacterium]|nr:CbtA family protein [Solirubrobacterales bacterium]